MDELLISNIIVGASTLLPAILAFLIKAEKPNQFVGYRTKWSMKNQETWKFANERAKMMMPFVSLLTIAVQIFSYFIIGSLAALLSSLAVFTIGLFIGFAWVEISLRNAFGHDGSPKAS